MTKVIGILKLLRPVNMLITFLTVLVAYFISASVFSMHISVWIAALAASLTAAAGNIVNDLFDVESDNVSHPDRPLVKKIISPAEAWLFYGLLNSVALALTLFIDLKIFIITLLAALLLFYYSYSLKKVILIGNIVVAFLTGLVFIYGGVLAGNPLAAVIPALFAFFINFIREIVKDMQDLVGDSKAGVITLPIKKGFSFSGKFAAGLSVILILLTLHPFVYEYYKIEYFLIVMLFVNPGLVYVIKNLVSNKNEAGLNKLSNILKLEMAIGLIAIFLGNEIIR